MGDNLPELLYRAYCNAMGLPYGSDETPSYHNLSTDKRLAWEAATRVAKATIKRRCLDDVVSVTSEFGEPGVAMLEERWFGRREVER